MQAHGNEASEVQYAHNGAVQIAYETFGDTATGAPLVLIMGLDFPMVWWPDDLCRALVDAGFAVVRFDNRDTGLSTRYTTAVRSPLAASMGRTPQVYSTLDLLADTCAVMDCLEWRSAHVMGGSMGGVLAQGMALFHPERVRSLISCMAMPAGVSAWRAMTYLRPSIFTKIARARRTVNSPEDEIENVVATYRLIASPGYPLDEDWVRQTAELTVQRGGLDPGTSARQMAAARGIHFPKLSTITAPTLVISGDDDPLVKLRGGRDTAAQIPGATFVSYSGMGHDLPRPLWPSIIDEIAALSRPRT